MRYMIPRARDVLLLQNRAESGEVVDEVNSSWSGVPLWGLVAVLVVLASWIRGVAGTVIVLLCVLFLLAEVAS